MFEFLLYLKEPHTWLFCTLASFLLGACIGSFLNVCIYRIPLDQSVAWPASHCMSCGHRLAWWQNLPILSYFLLRGKCHYCKAPFSARYALVELFTACLFVLPLLAYPPDTLVLDPQGIVRASLPSTPILGIVPLPSATLIPVLWLFLSGLVIATFVDFDHFIIPDSVSVGGIVAGLALHTLLPLLQHDPLWYHHSLHSLLGATTGFGILLLIAFLGKLAFRKEAMGMGDIKLLGAIGAFWGWQSTLFTLILAAFLGALVGILALATGKSKLGSRLPFGPYLALGSFIWVFWGPRILSWYLTFLTPHP